MKRQLHVTYERNGIYHALLAYAGSSEAVSNWFRENKPQARILAIHPATADDQRPGKPCITVG